MQKSLDISGLPHRRRPCDRSLPDQL